MNAQSEVLIASADSETRRTLASILSQWRLEPIFCSTVSKAKAIFHAMSDGHPNRRAWEITRRGAATHPEGK